MTVDLEKLECLLDLLVCESNEIRQQRWIRKQLKILRRLLKDKGKKYDSLMEWMDDFQEIIQNHFQISSSDLKWISETVFILEYDSTLATYENKCVTKAKVRQEAPRILMNLNSICETNSQNSFRRIIKNIFGLFNLYPSKIYEEMIECSHQRCKGHSDITLFRLKIIETILNRLLGKDWDNDISYN